MNRIIKRIRKKLIHFYTDGNINADFAAAKHYKCTKLRKIIRVCFYVHCAGAVICILIALLCKAGALTVPVALCALFSAAISFFAAGGTVTTRTVSYAADMVFAAVSFVAGTVGNMPFFYGTGGIFLLEALAALALFSAAAARDYLENYSPKLIRREDYTLIRNLYENDEPIADPQSEIPIVPPLTDEIQELAKQVSDILHGRES